MTSARSLLERDIERQLRSDPKLPAPPLIVTATPDVASLLHAIDVHGETCAAWETAGHAGSVGSTAQDAAVKLFTEHTRRSSPRIGLAASSQALVPKGIGPSVNDGAVTLEGQITWNYRRDAERGIEYLANAIGMRTLEPRCSTSQMNVESTLKWLPLDTVKE